MYHINEYVFTQNVLPINTMTTLLHIYIRQKESTKQKKIKIIITTILRRERTD